MRLGIAGCAGRMGQALIHAANQTPGMEVIIGSERAGTTAPGVPTITDDPRAFVAASDAVIDFTAPEATLAVAKEASAQGKIHIIGTTGFTPAQLAELKACAKGARIVQSGNFSLGINLLAALVEQAAARLGEEYDIDVFEMHHRHKKDAPSGTALLLGEAGAKGRNISLNERAAHDRNGVRKPGDIGFSVARGGDVVGEHTVYFAGPGEMLALTHRGFSRDIYAHGALRAALWAGDQRPGLYSMRDVLGV